MLMLSGIFTSSFVFAQSAAPILSYRKALAIAFERSPDILAAAAELRKTRGLKITADQPLVSNPELEANGAYGARAITPTLSFSPLTALQGGNPFDLSPNKVFGNTTQPIKGFELSLTQQLELAGKKSIVRNMAARAVDRASIAYERARLGVRGAVRANLMTFSAMERLSADLESRLSHLQKIRKRKGADFIDPRLGPYAAGAFTDDLLELEADRLQIEQTARSSKNTLRSLLMIADDVEFRAGNPDEIPLPALPDDQMLVMMARQTSVDLRDAEKALAMARDGARLARLLVLPDPSLFIVYGRQVTEAAGRFGPEREDERVGKIGIRFQLPVNSTRGERVAAKADAEKAQADLNRIRSGITSSVVTAAQSYRLQVALLDRLKRAVGLSAESLDRIDRAFVNGRISYFDFWNEYDRSNRLMKRYADTLAAAAASRGVLEVLIGRTLDKE
jgi:outer membrane protein TolC